MMDKQNNYKENLIERIMSKRGQVAIFVIVGIVIVVAGILIYAFYPQIAPLISGTIIPNNYLKDCISSSVSNGIATLSSQGGYANPEGYILYQGKQVKYLCYTSEYYKPCGIQDPLIKSTFEKELQSLIESKTKDCVAQLKTTYEQKGFTVKQNAQPTTKVSIVPNKVIVAISAPMTVSKDTTQTFNEFSVEYPSMIYNLLMITTSILDYESKLGDAATDIYLAYYPNMVVEKNKLQDGSKIYSVSDVTTNEKFVFATRGLSWPGGYGLTAQ